MHLIKSGKMYLILPFDQLIVDSVVRKPQRMATSLYFYPGAYWDKSHITLQNAAHNLFSDGIGSQQLDMGTS